MVESFVIRCSPSVIALHYRSRPFSFRTLDNTLTPMARKPPGLFITGTDTGVGKTYVAALIARELRRQGYNVGVYKPVATGCRACATGCASGRATKGRTRRKSELVSDDA